MKQRTKRFLATLLSLALVLSYLPTSVWAVDEDDVEDSQGTEITETTTTTEAPTESTTPVDDDEEQKEEVVEAEQAAATAEEETAEVAGETAVTYVAAIGDAEYETLQKAIDAATDATTIDLLANVTEDITIAAGKTIILNLNGKTLINSTDHTITNNGTLTINGTGLVDNGTNQKAAIMNNEGGIVTLNGGTYDRCNEDGQGATNSGTNSYYTLVNHGTMTINQGVTVTQHGKFSSMIENGYQDYTKQDPIYVANNNTSESNLTHPTLTINGGTFDGGLNTLKNDDHGIATINGGEFKNSTQNVILNTTVAEMTIDSATVTATGTYVSGSSTVGVNALWDKGKVTVNSGTFTSSDGYALVVEKKDTNDVTIVNGSFTSASGKSAIGITSGVLASSIKITGGTFSSDVSAYTANDYASVASGDGYKVVSSGNAVAKIGSTKYTSLQDALDAATEGQIVILVDDLTVYSTISITNENNITLDLNGNTLTEGSSTKAFPIYHTGTGQLTVKNGKIDSACYGVVNVTPKDAEKAGELVLDSVDISVAQGGGGCAADAIGADVTVIGGSITTTATDAPDGSVFYAGSGATVKITDCTITGQCYGVYCASSANVTVGGTTSIETKNSALAGNNTTATQNFTIDGGTYTSTGAAAIFIPGAGTVTISGDPTITGLSGICILMGELTINGNPNITGTYTGTFGAQQDFFDGSGPKNGGAAVVVIPNRYGKDQTSNELSVTINGGTYTSSNGRPAIDIEVADTYEQSTEIKITGGNFTVGGDAPEGASWTKMDAVEVTKKSDVTLDNVKPSITGGTFSSDVKEYVDEDSYASVKNSDGTYTVRANDAVAQIGNNTYTTLAQAIEAVPADSTTATTIKLLSAVTESVTVNSDANIVLDLNGNTMSGAMYIIHGNVTAKNGTIKNIVTVYGTTATIADGAKDYSGFTLDSTATIEANAYGIIVSGVKSDGQPTSGNTVWGGCYGVGATINVEGTLKNCEIFVMGNIGNNDATADEIAKATNPITINVKRGATFTADDSGYYGIVQNGYVVVNVYEGATITTTAYDPITIKRGVLNIYGGTFTSSSTYATLTTNPSGAEQTGAAVTVSSSYNDSGFIEVNISGGNFTSTNNAAVVVAASVKQDTEVTTKYSSGLKLNITDGNFTGNSEKGAISIQAMKSATESADVPYPDKPITGGKFSSDPSAYVASGYKATEQDSTYTVALDIAETEGKGSVTIDATDGESEASTEVVLPKSDDLSTKVSELTVQTDAATVTFNESAVEAIADNAKDDSVTVKVEEVATESLEKAQQEALAGMENVVVVSVTLTDSKGQNVTFNEKNGKATVKLPTSHKTVEEAQSYTVYYLADDGTLENMHAKPEQGSDGIIYMVFETSHFSYYYEGLDSFELKVTTEGTDYNVGDTIKATVSITGQQDSAFDSFQFKFDYDSDKLELVKDSIKIVTTASKLTTLTLDNQGIVYIKDTIDGTKVSKDTPVEIVTAEFKVKGNADTKDGITAKISVKDSDVSVSGEQTKLANSTESGTEITIHNIKITLKGDTDTTEIKSKTLTVTDNAVTLYAKYSEAGLYTSAERTTAVAESDVTAGAKTGYKLAETPWKVTKPESTTETTYASLAKILEATFAEDTEITLQTVQQYTVTFAVPTSEAHGSLTGDETYRTQIVDKDGNINQQLLPGTQADPGYQFDGWTESETGKDTIALDTYTVTKSVTLYARFIATTHKFALPETQTGYTVSITTGVDDYSTNPTAKYNRDVTFTISPTTGYVITSVAYTVDKAVQTTPTTTIADDGTWTVTIHGTTITGDVDVEINVSQYFTIEFNAGDNAEFAEGATTTAYALKDIAGLYASVTDMRNLKDASFTVPTPTASEGYRLYADTDQEPLWKDTAANSEKTYTTANVTTGTWTADTTLQVQTMKQFTITFAVKADDHGTLATGAETKIKVDTGTTVNDISMPKTTPNAGYEEDVWTWTKTNGGEAYTGTNVTEDLTATVSFKDAEYSIADSGKVQGVTLEYKTKTSTEEPDAYSTTTTATHGKDLYVDVTITKNSNVEIEELQYKIGDGDPAKVESNSTGTGITYPLMSDTSDQTVTFKIPGEAIIGTVTVIVQYKGTNTVTFQIAESDQSYGNFGTDKNSSPIYSVVKTYAADAQIQEGDVPQITYTTGYTGDWDVAPTDKTVDSNLTFTVIFQKATYAVSWTAETANASTYEGPTQATYLTDLTFKPTAVDGNIVTGVTYTVEGVTETSSTELKKQTATSNGDGTYTIPGDTIVGNIAVTVETTKASFDFITYAQYQALAGGTKIAVLTVDNKFEDKLVVLSAGTEQANTFYWSANYTAYLAIVDNSETAMTLSSKLSFVADQTEGHTSVAAYTLDGKGDVNGDNRVSIADAAIIKDVLKSASNGVNDDQILYGITDQMRLEMDVDGGTEANKKVTVGDIMWIMEKLAGLHNTASQSSATV